MPLYSYNVYKTHEWSCLLAHSTQLWCWRVLNFTTFLISASQYVIKNGSPIHDIHQHVLDITSDDCFPLRSSCGVTQNVVTKEFRNVVVSILLLSEWPRLGISARKSTVF
jgi:hypothetical protein